METKDALLHAINEEYVEAVEVLLEQEEQVHKLGEPHVSNSPHQTQVLFNYILNLYGTCYKKIIHLKNCKKQSKSNLIVNKNFL